jgi:glyoxylase-like metal-dependent hydrolase (beta-lactamase superfamily II)
MAGSGHAWRAPVVVLLALAAALAPAGTATLRSAGQQEGAQEPSEKHLRLSLLSTGASLYLLSGGGCNSLLLIRRDHVVLVDSKLPRWGQAVLDAIGLMTELPLTTVINTHGHVDHAGSNLELPDLTTVIAHENARASILTLPGRANASADGVPVTTVGKQMTLYEGRDRVDLYHFGPGHTNGDLVVVLPDHKIAYLGDLFPRKAAPVIDTARGGSAVALPETLGRIVRQIKDIDRVVAGHDPGPPPGTPRSSFGDILNWSDLVQYAAFNQDFLEIVRKAMEEQKSPEEALAALSLLTARYPGYDMQQARANVESIYTELNGAAGSAPAR